MYGEEICFRKCLIDFVSMGNTCLRAIEIDFLNRTLSTLLCEKLLLDNNLHHMIEIQLNRVIAFREMFVDKHNINLEVSISTSKLGHNSGTSVC